ncbi:MAG: hypothetical protein OEZ59_08815 [Deltaproteobacteria bacterium]|nr:hypothetical protein [Deltaproteobacteria bacterium]
MKALYNTWVLFALTASLGGCMYEREITWRIEGPTQEKGEQMILLSIGLWESATGVSFRLVEQDESALLVFKPGHLSTGVDGLASYEFEKTLDTDKVRMSAILTGAVITLRPGIWNGNDEEAKLRLFNHELGHVLANNGHTSGCPSTMNPNAVKCGTEWVDDEAASRVERNLSRGWLKDTRDPGLITGMERRVW